MPFLKFLTEPGVREGIRQGIMLLNPDQRPSDQYIWEDVIASYCCTSGAFDSGSNWFLFNSRQCKDIADYVAERAPFRTYASDAQRRVRFLQSDHIAIMELCRAIVEAHLFFQDCTCVDGADFWKNAYNSLTKLDTREAYEVLLHNLIWSKAGLDLAILYAGATDDTRHNIDYSKEIKKRVEECKCVLSRYRSDSAHRLSIDRDAFYRFVEDSSLDANESQKRCLDFLVEKCKAYQLLQSDELAGGGGGRAEHLFNVFKINPQDIGGDKDILGHGSFGVVYRRSWLGKAVAVKVFNGVHPEDELFKKEASLLADLQNPFIVHMVGWCSSTEKGRDCAMLVMELASTDLKEVIDQRPPAKISQPAAVDIMLQISKGMEYLHKKKIIHRDLKPKNVLLEPSSVKPLAADGYARVKLCDFGLAKVKEQSAKDQSQFTTFKLGTSYYRAPEILFEEDDVDKCNYTRKVDVFSFAITCSEILAGKTGPTCYKNLTSKKIRVAMLANVRPNLPPDCPSHLASLIKSCWDTDPNRRPPFSRVSNTLTYIKFILMRVPHVERVPYASVVEQFDEDELKRLASEDDEFVIADHGEEDSNIDIEVAKAYPFPQLVFMDTQGILHVKLDHSSSSSRAGVKASRRAILQLDPFPSLP